MDFSPYLILVAALVIVAGLALLGLGTRRLLQRRASRGVALGLGGIVVLVLAALGAATIINLRTYQRFTHEQAVAELKFKRTGPHAYQVQMSVPSGTVREFALHGDQWQLDARVMKWRGFATLLGLDPVYSLERLSGRYQDLALERSATRSVYGLTAHAGLDLWNMAQRHAQWLPWLDATYGSATYMPMADGARYAVHITATGLLARPLNVAARQALKGWR